MEKYLWFKVEFYDKNTLKTRYRTVKVKVSKYEYPNILETLKQKLASLGFKNIEILEYYIVNANYLRSPLKTKIYEYVAICLKCGNKNIIETLKPKSRLPKTVYAQCNKCKTTTEQHIIGKVLKTYKKWNTIKIKWFKPRKSRIPNVEYPQIRFPSFINFLHGASSHSIRRNPKTMKIYETIEFYYHNNLPKDLAFKLLVFDVNHEYMHSLLYNFIDLETCRKYDNPFIALLTEFEYLQIAFTTKQKQQILNLIHTVRKTLENTLIFKPINTITIN